MSFYGGKPGKSFSIDRVFRNFKELYLEAENSKGPMANESTALENYYLMEVPVGAYVSICYGPLDSEEYRRNREEELTWFSENPDKHPGRAAADYNATLWWDLPYADGADYNASVWQKNWNSEKGYHYNYIANVAGIIPEIVNGYWFIGQGNTGVRAIGREIELQVEENRELSPYALIRRTIQVEVPSETVEEGEEVTPTPPVLVDQIQYGLSVLSEKFVWNEDVQDFYLDDKGDYIYVYLSNSSGEFIIDDSENKVIIGYTKIDEWPSIEFAADSTFSYDYLQWRYSGLDEEGKEYEWQDLFDITGLTNLQEYEESAFTSAAIARNILTQAEEVGLAIDNSRKEIEENAEKIENNVAKAQGYAEGSESYFNKVQELVNGFEGELPPEEVILQEVINARGKGNAPFAALGDRLDVLPYQFDTIENMKACLHLARGNKCFTFGIDEVGNDDSKLFKIFDPVNYPEDKEALEKVDPDDPEGGRVITEQEQLANGLVAGLLTVFSGKGSGGGGGGSVGSISVTADMTEVDSGGTVTFSCYYTNSTRGAATLFVKDSTNKPVINAADNNIDYSKGVKRAFSDVGQTYTFTWKPSDGVHNLTFYALSERDGLYTNEQQVKITVGGVSLSTKFVDGSTINSNQSFSIDYYVKTIYSSTPAVLEYEVLQNGALRPDLSGVITSSRPSSNQKLSISFTQSNAQSIGSGVFKINARAYMQDTPEKPTPVVIRNFVIIEANTLALTTTFNSETDFAYQNETKLIPMTLVSSIGSQFEVIGEWSTEPGFSRGDGTMFPNKAELSTKGPFNFGVQFSELGTYYVRLYASGTGITATGTSEEIKINVVPKTEKYKVYDNGLTIHLNANKGQTNEMNKSQWANLITDANGESVYNADLWGFNYSSNGWETDANNMPTGYLYCNSIAYAQIDNLPFMGPTTYGNSTGMTLECVFKAADIGLEQTILSYPINGNTGNTGFFIYKDKAVATIGNTTATAYYDISGIDKYNDLTQIAFVLWREDEEVEDQKSGRTGYIKIYVNGSLTAAAPLPKNFTSQETSSLFLNCNADSNNRTYGVTKFDSVRLYNNPLTDTQVLRNYLYSLRDSYNSDGALVELKEDRQAKLVARNSLSENLEDDDILPASNSIPTMTFYINEYDWMKMDKDNYKPEIKIAYKDPLRDEDITWYNVKTSWQGTSSIAYPVKNFKLKLGKDLNGKKQKYSLGGKTLKEKTFCLKADYMDSSHCHNTGNANFFNDTGISSLYSLIPPQADEVAEITKTDFTVADGMKGLKSYNEKADKKVFPEDLQIRNSIYGFPILLYICIETPESAADKTLGPDEREYLEPMFWGIYNFNLDKGSNKSWGLFREDLDKETVARFPDCTSFEIAANTALTGGGFRALKWVKSNDGQFGWTRPTVWFTKKNGIYEFDKFGGTYYEITLANEDGSLKSSDIKENDIVIKYNRNAFGDLILDSEGNPVEISREEYEPWYNGEQGISGYAVKGAKYVKQPNGEFARDDNASSNYYLELFEVNDVTGKVLIDGFDNPTSLGYYLYNINNWTVGVKLASVVYFLKDNWSIDNNLPENKDYYYSYYSRDFELRFPDEDLYLYDNNGEDEHNALYYKEYDKIISIVDWIDTAASSPNAEEFAANLNKHVQLDTAINYYLFVQTVGLIDNFGKNLMFDTWGYDVNGEVPYDTLTADGTLYHKVRYFDSQWDADEEKYLDKGEFRYGLMDISNPIDLIYYDGDKKKTVSIYNVYKATEDYNLILINGEKQRYENIPGAYAIETERTLKYSEEEIEDFNIPFEIEGTTYYAKEDVPEHWEIISLKNGKIVYNKLNENGTILAYSGDFELGPIDQVDSNIVGCYDFNKVDGDRQNGWYHEIHLNQILWYPRPYDLDSCLGVDNLGNLRFTPSIEMTDEDYILFTTNELTFAAPFNTSISQLWYNLSTKFNTQISERFRQLSGEDGILLINKFEEVYFNRMINTLGERWYNEDSYPKYLSRKAIKVIVNGKETSRFPNEFTSIAYGNDWQRIKRWISHRLNYLSSMFDRDTDNTGSGMAWRASTPNVYYTFNVSTYEPCYIKLISGKGATPIYRRIRNYNGSETLQATLSYNSTDQEMFVGPAANIKKMTAGEGQYFGQVTLTGADRMLELDLHGGPALKKINLADNKNKTYLIQKINCANCQAYDEALDQSRFPLLKEIDLSNTNATFTFDANGGILQKARLSSATKEISIRNHYELTNVTLDIKYPKILGATENPQKEHSTELSSLKLVNCPKITFDYNPLYLEDARYVPLGDSTSLNNIATYVKDYGILSLFQGLTTIQLSNSLAVEPYIETGSIETIYPLKLCHCNLNYVEITNSGIDTILMIAKNDLYSKGLDSNNNIVSYTQKASSYPGTGGSPDVNDSNLGQDGLNCDDNIKSLIIEKSNTSSTFEFPWRVYLGSLGGLETLKFNVTNIKVKSITEANALNGAAYKLGIGYNGITVPQRFELVLPSFYQDDITGEVKGIKKIYINPAIDKIDFTCIRQPSDDIEKDYTENNSINQIARANYYTIQQPNSNKTSQVKYFPSIDIRNYVNLEMNFKGLHRIVGILGMEAINIDTYLANNNYSLEGYFKNCNRLQYLAQVTGGAFLQWNFSNRLWSANNNIVSLKEFFANCNELPSQFVTGMYEFSGNGLEDASGMFVNCKALTTANIKWPNNGRRLNNVDSLFSGCSGLKNANIRIENISELKSLYRLFHECSALEKAEVNLFESNLPGMYLIENVQEMFYKCGNLISMDMNAQKWNFNNLRNAANWFAECTRLQTLNSPDNMNFGKVTNFNSAFKGCTSLINIFGNTNGAGWVLNDGTSTEALSLNSMFSGCSSLENIGNMYEWDVTRVSDIAGLFNGCNKLRGSALDGENYAENVKVLNLSNWTLNPNKVFSLSQTFRDCSQLKGILLPAMSVSNLAQTFQGCSSLTTLDLNKLIPKTLTASNLMLQGCTSLNSLSGYEEWNMNSVETISSMFAGCNKLTSLDLSKWRLLKLQYGEESFLNCSSLSTIVGLRDLFGNEKDVYAVTQNQEPNEPINTGTVLSVAGMFSGCSNLKLGNDVANKCDIRAWGQALKNVKTLAGLFKNCTQITDISNVVVTKPSAEYLYAMGVGIPAMRALTDINSLLEGCSKLSEVKFENTVSTVSTNVWPLNLYGSGAFEENPKLATVNSIVSGCSELENFVLGANNMFLSNLTQVGSANMFSGCSKLKNINFLQGYQTATGVDLNNGSLKQTLDLSPLLLLADSSTAKTSWDNLLNNDAIIKSLFRFKIAYKDPETGEDTFTDDPVPNIDMGEGLIQISNSQRNALTEAEFLEISKRFAARGWSVKVG